MLWMPFLKTGYYWEEQRLLELATVNVCHWNGYGHHLHGVRSVMVCFRGRRRSIARAEKTQEHAVAVQMLA